MKFTITGYGTTIEIEAESEEAAMAEYLDLGFVEIEETEEAEEAKEN